MKKQAIVFAVAALAVGLLYGCGNSYEATESTVFIQKDGSVISTDIEAFDTTNYDERELRAFVSAAIDEYTTEHGTDSVQLNELLVEEGKAKLTIEYATAKDYERFNDIDLFTGSVAEALAAGYTFDGEFAEYKDGTKTLCDASSFLNGDGYKVVIIKSNTNVRVNGKVKYASASNVSLIDNSTVAISSEYIDPDTTIVEETEETESLEDIIDTMTSDPSSADEGSIDDDDLLLDEEEAQVVFEFEEQERPHVNRPSSENSSYTNVYTYIIYK